MTLSVNGKEKSYDKSDLSVSELLSIEEVETPEMVTVQVNGKFVSQYGYKDTRVHEGDEVQYLYYMGGGSSYYRPPRE